MSTMPMSGGIERTAAVVIGTGLSGLAVASELQRRGVDSIIVDGLDLLGAGHPANTSSLQRCDAADAASLRERNEILRHLRNYAASHKLDVRNNIRALQLDHVDAGVTGPAQQWAVRTPGGVLLADHLVLTRCAHSQLPNENSRTLNRWPSAPRRSPPSASSSRSAAAPRATSGASAMVMLRESSISTPTKLSCGTTARRISIGRARQNTISSNRSTRAATNRRARPPRCRQ